MAKLTTRKGKGEGKLYGELGELVQLIRRHLYLPDVTPLYLSLATVLSNRCGDQVWMMLVGPAGCGGTEMLMMVSECEWVRMTDRFTEGGLVSGVSSKEFKKGAKGGLLFELKVGDTLLVKDFTGTIVMRQDMLGPVMGALRDISDGRFSRSVGGDGGREVTWEGRIGMLTKCTPAIDKVYATISQMGDRFVYYRYREEMGQGEIQAMTALAQSGWDSKQLRKVVQMVLSAAEETNVEAVGEMGRKRIVACASLCGRARTGMERDRWSKEITNVDETESPARLALQFQALHTSMRKLGVPEKESWDAVRQVALGTVPGQRGKAIRGMIKACFPRSSGGEGRESVTMGELCKLVHMEGRELMIRRAMEELEVLGLVERVKGGKGRVMTTKIVDGEEREKADIHGGRPRDLWRATEWLRERWATGWGN